MTIKSKHSTIPDKQVIAICDSIVALLAQGV